MTNCRNDIAFGSFVLNQRPFIVDAINTYSAPNLAVARLPRLTRPGAIISQSRYEEKLVEVSGRIVAAGAGRETMVRRSDLLKRELQSGRRDLSVGYTDGRVYLNAQIAGTVELEWNELDQNEILWTAPFLCPDPLLADPEVTVTSDVSELTLVTGSEYAKSMTFDLTRGTAFSYPRFVVTMPSLTAFGITRVWIINTSVEGSPRIDVPFTFAPLNVLEIDGDDLTVKINDIEAEWEGQFVPIDRRAGATNVVELHVLATSTPTVAFQADWRARWF